MQYNNSCSSLVIKMMKFVVVNKNFLFLWKSLDNSLTFTSIHCRKSIVKNMRKRKGKTESKLKKLLKWSSPNPYVHSSARKFMDKMRSGRCRNTTWILVSYSFSLWAITLFQDDDINFFQRCKEYLVLCLHKSSQAYFHTLKSSAKISEGEPQLILLNPIQNMSMQGKLES